MTEQPEHPQDNASATPTHAARAQWRAETGRRRQTVVYSAVAVVCLIIGGAAVYGALLAGWIRTGGPAAAKPAAGHEEAAGGGGGDMAGMSGMGGSAEPAGEKPAGIYISPARQQLIGVRTARVEHRALETTIRTVGTLAYDETRVTQMNTKVSGWIERVFVDYVGKPVRRGQPLFSVYSPDLVATQNEYLLALKAQKQFASSQIAETRASSQSLLAATRERLKLWDITDAQIAELEQTGQPRRTLTIFAPFDGIVLERNAFAGQYITPEMATFKLADLSTLWVIGQVFEYELGQIAMGQRVTIEFPYGEYGKSIEGRIGFIYPDIDPQTRRARVRVDFQNPSEVFKPGTYVTVSIQTRGGHLLAIPKEAVIDTGAKQVAILAHPNGYFEPREIKVGEPTNDFYPLLDGLAEGDQIVTSAQFLVDSEANLQSAMQAMSMSMPGMDMGVGKGEQKPAPPPKTPPTTPSGEMPGMPGMKKSPEKAPDMKDMPGMKPAPPKKTPGEAESMDDMPGMPGMKTPTAKKPVPPKKSGGEGGVR